MISDNYNNIHISKGKIIFAILFVIIFIIGIIFIQNSQYKVRKFGVIDTATVVSIDRSYKGFIKLQYVVNNITYFNHESFSEYHNYYVKIGDKFLIKFLPSDPSNSVPLKDHNNHLIEVFDNKK